MSSQTANGDVEFPSRPLLSKILIDSTWNLSETPALARILRDSQNNVWMFPTVLASTRGATVSGKTSLVTADIGPIPQGPGGATGIGPSTLGSNALSVNALANLFNGTNYDVQTNNLNLQSAADVTTATYTGPDIRTYNARALMIIIDVTAFSDTSYTPEIDWKDGAGNYPVLWQQKTVKTGAARTVIILGPGSLGAQVVDSATVGDAATGTTDSATASQLVQIGFPVPPIIRIKVTKVHAAGAYTGNYQVVGS